MEKLRIKESLVKYHNMTEREAKRIYKEMQEELFARLEIGDIKGAFGVCGEYGLDADYLEDLV